ncbi:MAG: penicillin-binding protein [Bacteroidota bacterium]
MEIKKSIMSRIGVVYVVAFIGTLAILGQVLYIQTVNGEEWRQEAENMSQRHQSISASRGNILSRDENALASSLPRFNVAMDPNSTGMDQADFNRLLPDLATGLNHMWPEKTADQYLRLIRNTRDKGDKYVTIHKEATFDEARKVRQLPLFSLGQYKGGLILEQVSKREKPYQMLAGRTIGYLSESEKGTVVGIEGSFDYFLRGRDGMRLIERLGGGTWMPLNTENEINPEDGLDVVTTLDVNLQDVAQDALNDQLVQLQAQHGCAVLMEVATGEILAMANLGLAADGNYYEDLNYAISECVEPGSTFKVPALMCALEDGYVELTDTIQTFGGRFILHNQPVTDAHTGGFGLITVRDVIQKSSNIGMARITDKYYQSNPEHFLERLYGMGINKSLNLEIEGGQDPRIKTPASKTWSKGTVPWMGFGYEVEMTPLQTLTFYNAIANNGKMVKPMLVRYLKSNSQPVKTYKTEVLQASICSDETLRKVRSMLEGVVTDGTAKNLKNDLYTIAGKTGTAVISQGSKGYRNDTGQKDYRASFVGYFPADNPKYSCIVVVTRPSMGSYYGNVAAGNVFRAIADKVYATNLEMHSSLTAPVDSAINTIPFVNPGNQVKISYLLKELKIPFIAMKQEDPWAGVIRADQVLKVQPVKFDDGRFPDLTGMGLRDVLPVLENMGYKVRVRGSGKIYSQVPPPGTPADSVGIVELQLSVL